MSSETPAPKPAVEHPETTTPEQQGATSAATTDRARRREAALRRLQKANLSKRTAGLLGLTAVIALAGITTAGTLWVPTPPAMDTTARAAELPATPLLTVCSGAPALPEDAGADEDLDFSPLSSDAATALTVSAISDLAGTIPGMTYTATSTDSTGLTANTKITDSLAPELQQGPPATAATDGTVTTHGFFDVISDPTDSAANPVILAIEPVGGTPGMAAGSFQYAATDGDLAGLTVTACTPAAHQHWLTGAITTPGTTAVLTVTNPSATASTVDLTVFDTDGRVETSGGSNIVLAPGQTRSVLVAGFAPRKTSVAVQVAASGGPVTAHIHQHRLDGIVPAGVDTLEPATVGTHVVIPGIHIDDDAQDIAETSGLTGQTPSLHLAATGGAAQATITLRGAEGPVDLPTEATAVNLAPGTTETIDLSGVTPGTYAVEITADAHLIASATSLTYNPAADDEDATGNTQAVDTAYMPSTTPIRGETMVSLPALRNPTAQLVLTAGEEATVAITPVDADGELGETRSQELAPNTAITITDDDAAGYLLETGSNAVHAGVIITSTNGISAMPVNTVTEAGSGLPVRLGY